MKPIRPKSTVHTWIHALAKKINRWKKAHENSINSSCPEGLAKKQQWGSSVMASGWTSSSHSGQAPASTGRKHQGEQPASTGRMQNHTNAPGGRARWHRPPLWKTLWQGLTKHHLSLLSGRCIPIHLSNALKLTPAKETKPAHRCP